MWLEAPPSTPGISPRARLDHRLARYPITTITSALDSDLVTKLGFLNNEKRLVLIL